MKTFSFGIFITFNWLACAMPILYAQLADPFNKIERRLIESDIAQIDIKKYRLASFGNDIAIISTYNFEKLGHINCDIVTPEGTLKSNLQLKLSKKDHRKISKYRLIKVLFSFDDVFVLFSDYLLVGNLSANYGAVDMKLIELKSSYDNIEYANDYLFLLNCGKQYGSKLAEKSVYISVFDISAKYDFRIAEFQPEDHFLLNFQSRSFFAFSDSQIFYVHPDNPLITEMDFEGRIQRNYPYSAAWTKVSDTERILLNELSNSNPQMLFAKVGDRILNGQLSMNIRIDRLSNDLFAVTCDSGQQDSLSNVRFRFDIWKLTQNNLEYISSANAPLAQQYILNADGTTKFGFHAYDGSIFFYRFGRRYQLNIEPHIDQNITDIKKIEQAKQQSILENKFDLCLYIGTLNLP